MFVLRQVGAVLLFLEGKGPNECDIPLMSCSEECYSKGLLPMLFPAFSVALKNTLSSFQTPGKKRLLMVSAAYVSSLGPAEESPSGLFLPCPPAQLCISLWQMADPDLSQVTPLCQHLELCLEALGPQGSALGPVLPLHSHLLKQSQATRAAHVSAPAANHGCGVWCRLHYQCNTIKRCHYKTQVCIQISSLSF